uniref:Uncharacterized protein n=1 Tax=viral metagenome TaxID=1070528 RepID=A0A6H2A010_9ZZZZ
MENHKRLLLDLLAVIHRDGGQYTAEHSIEKSAKDATKIVADALVGKSKEESLSRIIERMEKGKWDIGLIHNAAVNLCIKIVKEEKGEAIG